MEVSERMSFCGKQKQTLIYIYLSSELLMINSLYNTHLQVLWAKLMSIHVNGRQKDGLHLVVPQFI